MKSQSFANFLLDIVTISTQKPYLRYLQNASESIDYGRELSTRLPDFGLYAEWCQKQRPIKVAANSAVIQNLSLDSIQSNPHQRITRQGSELIFFQNLNIFQFSRR